MAETTKTVDETETEKVRQGEVKGMLPILIIPTLAPALALTILLGIHWNLG